MNSQRIVTQKTEYTKNPVVVDKSIESLLKRWLDCGMLQLSDVMNSGEEDIMRTVLDNVHRYEISRLADGRYYTYVPDETKPKGRRQVRKKSLTGMYKFLIGFYGLTGQEFCDKTFGDLFAEWVEYKKKFIGAPNAKKSLSPSTICRYERDYSRYVKGTDLDSFCILDITTTIMETFILQMIESHEMNDRCAGNIFGYLNQAFEYARRSKYLTENPMDLIDKKLLLSRCVNPPEKGDEERILTKTEIRDLQKAISDHQAKIPGYMPDYAIRLAMFTGMRIGELAALKWSCIDDVYIHIDFSEHRLDYSGRKSDVVVGEPKNRKHRLIPVTKDIRSLLEEIRNASVCYDENGFVFTNDLGERCTARIIGNAATKRFNEAGISHGSIHRIRRTVSSMLNQVLPQKDVSALLGHTETVNEMYYNYSTADTKEKANALSHLSSNIIHLTGIPKRKKA